METTLICPICEEPYIVDDAFSAPPCCAGCKAKAQERQRQEAEDRQVPEIVKESLDLYAKDGIPTGDFLRAVLENNLMESFGRADRTNRHCMFAILSYVYNHIPLACHGSPEKVDAWIEKKGKEREEKRKAANDKGGEIEDVPGVPG